MDTAQSRPRFRSDLVAKPFDDAGQRFVDVTDPDSGKTFRFYEVEYSIACAMDGRRDLAGLSEWAQVELGLEPSPDELSTVIATLDDLGYLQTQDAGRAAAQGGEGGFDLGFAGSSDETYEDESLTAGDDDEFELGSPGKSPLDNGDEERLDAPEITLGVSGNESIRPGGSEFPPISDSDDEIPTVIKQTPRRAPTAELGAPPEAPPEETAIQPVLRPVARERLDDDGPTNIPPPATDFDEEVSVDLTDHMRIGAADVQEAVRQSKVIPAVNVPGITGPDVADDEDDDSPATTEREPIKTPPPMAAARPATAPPTELPDTPAPVTAKPLEDSDKLFRAGSDGIAEPPRSRAGLVILLLLLVLVAGAAAAYFFWYVPMEEAKARAAQEAAAAEAAAEAEPEPEPEPEPPSATMASVAVEPVTVEAAEEGEIEVILEAGSEVEENAIVVRFDGFQRAQRQVEANENDIERYQKRVADSEEALKAAEAEGDENAVKRHARDMEREQGKIEARQASIAEAMEEMAPFLLRAPVAGVVQTERASGDKVAAGDTVFGIELPPRLEAVFTVENGEPPAEATEVTLAAKDDAQKTMRCAATKVDGQEVTVTCPSEGDLGADDEVVLMLAAE
ncbi:hypothetical protein [Haliangium ochraceum]|uniref:Uncharacterized protein n=1 Tax=Haliangium ochraceum (strain DSM 14365 / JCM 11303 / SMP-2) TaxID=502025 RepID=D0LUK6_HALO1|nr:hypothetical protein [Haliangium ochraceum]ACY19329.1 hypothetical protein Hoch_6865 [Haliangium ochraceum DSM 14365]